LSSSNFWMFKENCRIASVGCLFPFSSRRFIQSCDPSEVDGQTCTGMYAHIHTKLPLLNHHTERQPFASSVPGLTPWQPWAANLFLVSEGTQHAVAIPGMYSLTSALE
jgi:hypothetical protein